MSRSTDARSFRRTHTRTAQGRYLLLAPDRYRETPEASWPLLLFLHGAGERGQDIDPVTRHGPLAEPSPDDLPLLIVAAQCPAGSWWTPADMLALRNECEERYRVDPARIYGTGISMGATGLWAVATDAPGRFAAIVPICGRADPLRAPALTDVPSWAFHGAQDAVIPPRAIAHYGRRHPGTRGHRSAHDEGRRRPRRMDLRLRFSRSVRLDARPQTLCRLLTAFFS